jgi:hypothetical protein
MFDNKDPEAFKRFLIDTAKRDLECGDDDFLPTIVIEDVNGRAIVMVLVGGHPFDMVLAALPALREHQPATVSLTTDGYMAQGVEGLASKMLFGDLSKALAAGAPGVTEALTIHIVTPESTDLVMLPYVREDDGHIVWSDPPEDQEGLDVGGRMSDALRMVWVEG